ncbi:hypothetical protein U27_03587 [Candidatus Vecturithrix granuli]|uniref:Uncharacterized protein n=1 Tax=Vecturithrix granuli TaxID=1499967 RepID=A0A081BWB9_VECG1|nr:hypothetical protein U27_03587 [Candidatus Vecturithrix granuli]
MIAISGSKRKEHAEILTGNEKLQTGDRAQALTLFNQANTTLDELGLKRLANEANHLIKTWGQQ